MLKRKPVRGKPEVLDKAIEKLARQLDKDELRGTMADLIRLLQMREEKPDSERRPLTVRWVDQCRTPGNEK